MPLYAHAAHVQGGSESAPYLRACLVVVLVGPTMVGALADATNPRTVVVGTTVAQALLLALLSAAPPSASWGWAVWMAVTLVAANTSAQVLAVSRLVHGGTAGYLPLGMLPVSWAMGAALGTASVTTIPCVVLAAASHQHQVLHTAPMCAVRAALASDGAHAVLPCSLTTFPCCATAGCP